MDVFKNAMLFCPDGSFRRGGFSVENGHFRDVFFGDIRKDGTDLSGAPVLPGLVDIHIHGAMGADFSDGDAEGTARIARYLAAHGITSFAPASMTLPYDVLARAYEVGLSLHEHPLPDGARLMGINMEGPFFSEKKKGAQNGAYLRNPDFGAFEKLYNGCKGLIRVADIAPELPGSVEFIEKASRLCTVSIAHTDCTYEEASAAFDAGAAHLTHLYNAMPSIHHRKPGPIGAGSEREGVVAELISDGLHVHPSAVRMAFRLFPGRVCLISDALRCLGMPDGAYTLGGQNITLAGRLATLVDGTIAGSATNLFDCMRNAVSFGIAREEAICSATIIPAREIGRENEIGSIAPGRYADFLICSDALELQTVYISGKPLS